MKKPTLQERLNPEHYLFERTAFNAILLFVAAALLMMIGGLIARDEQKARQTERLATYDWYDEDCFARRDINWVLHGINE
tara:strand:+ start:79 stop:318 length:240 start_codon:yes stop_codon:yes gene_type:complete